MYTDKLIFHNIWLQLTIGEKEKVQEDLNWKYSTEQKKEKQTLYAVLFRAIFLPFSNSEDLN